MKDFIVRDEESLGKMLARVRAAQEKFASYTQEQVDRIFYRAALAANKQRLPLAKMAVDETGMGVVEDKVIKNNYAAEYIYRDSYDEPDFYRNFQVPDLLENEKRTYHFPASPRQKKHNRSGAHRFGSGGGSGRARRHHRVDRRTVRSAFGYDYARS